MTLAIGRWTLLGAGALVLGGWAGAAAGQPSQQSCVDVQVGTAQSYDCINQKLQALSREAHSANASPPDAIHAPENQTGQFNESATRNRLGANFGKSVTPPRPVPNFPPAFGAPK